MEQKNWDKSGKCQRAGVVAQLIGRLLIGLFFLHSALTKFTTFAATVAYSETMGLPLASILVALAILLEVVCSIAIILGLGARIASFALALFVLVATLIFHRFWSYPPEMVASQSMSFWKNLSIIGGMLVLASYPCGSLKSVCRFKPKKA